MPGGDEPTVVSELIAGAESVADDPASNSEPADGGAPFAPSPSFAPRPVRPDYRARSGGYQGPAPRPGVPVPASWARQLNPPPPGLLGEDEELIAGRHPVEEAFIARRKAIRLLVVPQRRQALEKLVLHATNLRIPIVEVEGGTLTSLAGFDGHQGIALITDKRQFAGLNDILARAIERQEPPFVLVLDSLEDPQNFGALLRTAEASGVHGVIYPTHRQAPLSAAAIKASAGAVEHLLLVPVDDLAEALTDLHIRGLRVIGSDADAQLTARQADLRGPVVIVVGSEGQGLGPSVRRRCDTVVRIPMLGHVSSLNASVAGSILLYEASSQRGVERPPTVSIFAPDATPDSEPDAETNGVIETAEGAADIVPAAPATSSAPRKRRQKAPTEAQPEPAEGSSDATASDEALLPGAPADLPQPDSAE
jgi:23S rRNA (guanosine2251-2'-O)-methyltransferase